MYNTNFIEQKETNIAIDIADKLNLKTQDYLCYFGVEGFGKRIFPTLISYTKGCVICENDTKINSFLRKSEELQCVRFAESFQDLDSGAFDKIIIHYSDSVFKNHADLFLNEAIKLGDNNSLILVIGIPNTINKKYEYVYSQDYFDKWAEKKAISEKYFFNNNFEYDTFDFLFRIKRWE